MRLVLKKFLFLLGFSLLCVVVCCFDTAGTEESLRLIRENQSIQRSSLFVSVSVDHKDRVYYEGNFVKITVNAGDDGYLYLINKGADGSYTLLYPNELHQDCRVLKNDAIHIPSEERSGFRFRIHQPFGEEELVAILSKEELDFSKELKGDSVRLSSEEVKKLADEVIAHAGGGGSGKVFDSVAESHIRVITQKRPEMPEISGKGGLGRYLFCVGVDKYSDPNICNLNCCANDAAGIESLFCSCCGVARKNVFRLTGEHATFKKVEEYFTKILPELPAGSTLFIYWSGHCGLISNSEKGNTEEVLACLYPFDGIRGRQWNGVTEDLLGHWIDGLKDKNIVLIFDACYSGMLSSPKKNGDSSEEENSDFTFGTRLMDRARSISLENKSIITSSASDETSLGADSHDKNSLMTKYIISVISDCKMNGENAVLTPNELVRKIRDDVAREAKERKGNSGSQTVIADGDTAGTINILE